MPEVDLERFVDAQRNDFDRALAEIEAGRKRSHWMWYVFPQVIGLGLSPTSRRYAIENVDEARAFLAHPVLGDRYRRIVDAVWHQVVERGVTINDLFGIPDDAKLVSSLTLFMGVARQLDAADLGSEALIVKADEILQAATAQGLAPCKATERFAAT